MFKLFLFNIYFLNYLLNFMLNLMLNVYNVVFLTCTDFIEYIEMEKRTFCLIFV